MAPELERLARAPDAAVRGEVRRGHGAAVEPPELVEELRVRARVAEVQLEARGDDRVRAGCQDDRGLRGGSGYDGEREHEHDGPAAAWGSAQ
jgi:hypothetical protein